MPPQPTQLLREAAEVGELFEQTAASGERIYAATRRRDERLSGISADLQTRLQRRAAQNRTEKASDASSLAKLQAVRPPSAIAFLALAVAGLLIDLLDILLTFADAAALVGTVISIILNIGMFLAIRSVMNRGPVLAWFLAACIIGGIAASVVPIVGSVVASAMLGVVLIAGVVNPNASAIKGAREGIQAPLERMSRSAATARQRTAQVVRLARRAGKYSKRMARLTRSVVRSKAFRSFAKGSRVFQRMLAGQVLNSVPILRFLPFQLLTVWMTYRELKRNHQEAQQMLAEYTAIASEETDALAAEAVARAEAEAAQLAADFPEQEQEAATFRRERPQPPPQITDIADPTRPAARVVRPVPQESPRAAVTPLRDIVAAA